MTVYAPGTEETDLKKLNMSLQQNAGANTANADNIAANTAAIAANTAAIAAITPATPATQADQEAATSTTTMVTPGRQKYHPAHPKAWAYVTQSAGTYTLQSSFGISGISKAATGRVDLTLSTAFSSVNYAAIGGINDNPNLVANEVTGSRSTTNYRIMLRNANTAADTDANFSVMFFGDQ